MTRTSTALFGYDPSADKELLKQAKPFVYSGSLPESAQVDMNYLPPVGEQGTAAHLGAPPTCAAWAYIYGLVGVNAAINQNFSPATPENQASPAHIYIQVMQADDDPNDCCKGTSFSTYPQFFQNGTPNMEAAPYSPDCETLWSSFNNDAPVDDRFAFPKPSIVKTDDLHSIKSVLATGRPLCYATVLDSNFVPYSIKDPVPYVGNGQPTGARHCMLIVGYDHNCGPNGAVYLQNSFGTKWGHHGRVWMDVVTFQSLSEGSALYFPS